MDSNINELQKILVGSKEAARMLSISERKLFEMRKNGEMGFLKQNGRVLYSVEEANVFSENAHIVFRNIT